MKPKRKNTPPRAPDDGCDLTSADEVSKVQQDRYRVLIEDVADGFYETSLKGDFLFFNHALCLIFGYPRDEIQNRNYRDFMDDSNARLAYEHFNQIYETGEGITDIVWQIIRKDGERRYVEISANLILDDRGNKCGFRGIARDITEKYRIQEALKESEKRTLSQYAASRKAERRYRALMAFLPDPVFVFHLDGTVDYVNPAFAEVFGWTLEELRGKRIPFVPESLKEETRLGEQRLMEKKVIRGVETKRLTKDGSVLDILLDGAIFYEDENEPAGHVIILRDITSKKLAEKSNNALFRIAKALPQYRRLDDLLEFIIKEIKELLAVQGAMVILLDEEKKEFFFREAAFDDSETGKKFKEVRFPVDKGVAGHVYRTGKPIIVPDTSKSPYFFRRVDEQAEYETRSMLDVPMRIQDRFIGVLCAVNKKDGEFNPADGFILSTIAGMVGLPIENARINDELKRSYEDVKSLNRAKDRVIHHLSHELKTPVAVLSASLGLLNKRLPGSQEAELRKILDRAQRNLQRILDMQYQIEDILREKAYRSYHLLSNLLDVCADELEALALDEFGNSAVVDIIRGRIRSLFGPKDAPLQEIDLGRFVDEQIRRIAPRFAHRTCKLVTQLEKTPAVRIPADVLAKTVEGLIRNAVENTPDGGRIVVAVRNGSKGPEFEVSDLGVGITDENQRLIFESNFTTYDTMQYTSRKPYDFSAGGKGFDLLRMKIFSERYDFEIRLTSKRCRYIPTDSDLCPGAIDACRHCERVEDCFESGGTAVLVRFKPAQGSSTTDFKNQNLKDA